jgi:putative membrane protein
LHGILSLLLLVLVIVGSVGLVRSAIGAGLHGSHSRSCSPSLDVLQECYAQGEIQRDEYLQKTRDLGGCVPPQLWCCNARAANLRWAADTRSHGPQHGHNGLGVPVRSSPPRQRRCSHGNRADSG